MDESILIRNLYTKCRSHGNGSAQVVIADSEIYALIILAFLNLGWMKKDDSKYKHVFILPSFEYYEIPLDWFIDLNIKQATPTNIKSLLSEGCNTNQDFYLFISNLSALHRRRIKYKRILSTQPIPNMDQVGPRVLLEFGLCNTDLLANWMLWRKWIYDIDNRSAQETGYIFEPILASCLGGESIGARNSPIKRINSDGAASSKGRQVDCLIADSNQAYELKLRVTIAASGQGRFAEELSFPTECFHAGYIPVLLVLDPTPSTRLDELSQKFIDCDGVFYQGEEAWEHMEEQAGEIMGVFIAKYIKPAIKLVDEMELSHLQKLTLEWNESNIVISNTTKKYTILRG